MEANASLSFKRAIETHAPGFETYFLAKFFGAEFSYSAGSCFVSFNVEEFMLNPQGSLHGGVTAFALDSSMGHLIHHTIGRAAVTIELKVQYMRAVKSGRVVCKASFLQQGRSVSFLESRMTDADGKLVAVATSTWKMPQPETIGDSRSGRV